MSTTKDRVCGALVGLAVGDALGAQVEFSERGIQVTDYGQYKGPWNLPSGGWTDDTAQALCLADALLEGHSLKTNPEKYMDKFIQWADSGYNSCVGKAIGIGGTTLKSLKIYSVTGQIHSPTDFHSAGNGCIMRLAPIPISFAHQSMSNWGSMLDACELSCVLTHGAYQSKLCTRLLGSMIYLALTHASKSMILQEVCNYYLPEDFNDIITEKFKIKTADGTIEHKFGNTYHSESELKSDGYCINTLECALWAFYHTNTFEDGMIKVISLGGDTDTIAAVYGQLAGAYYGYDAIPQRWKNGLMWHDHIVDIATRLGGQC